MNDRSDNQCVAYNITEKRITWAYDDLGGSVARYYYTVKPKRNEREQGFKGTCTMCNVW